MLLVMDVGNTNMVLGVYQVDGGAALLAHWRVRTSNYRTTDEVRMLLTMLFQQEGLEPGAVKGCCIASVVPPLNFSIEKACRLLFGVEPLSVGPGIKTGLVLQVENPKEVGADRIASAVGAISEYDGALVVVDFGTATTFDVITGKHEYRGGAILPGIQISADVLFERCAKLQRIELAKPPTVIGRDTATNIRIGLTYGYADMVDGLLARIIDEMGESPTVVATGGFSSLISGITTRIEHFDPELTLKGLRTVYDRNQKGGAAA